MQYETVIGFDNIGNVDDVNDTKMSVVGESFEEMEMQTTETVQQPLLSVTTKRNDISQSRLYNGYSVPPEKGIKDLPLRSFSSPMLWPADLNKIQSPVTTASMLGSVPFASLAPSAPSASSLDALFSKQISPQYSQTSSQQISSHTSARADRSAVSRFGFHLHAEPFTPASISKPSTVFHGPSSSSLSPLATSPFSYDHRMMHPVSYDNYGYPSRWVAPDGKDKQSSQRLNDSDTTNTGSQNSNISNTFIPSCTSALNPSDNSLQESGMAVLKTTARAEDGVIPSAIVVKNIPFQIKKEQLLELFDTLDIPKPYAFNYHFDNGNFRGLAFANFYTPEETTRVILSLNGHDIMGRKLRVEYKRVLPVTDREKMNREKKEKRNPHEEPYNSFSSVFSRGKGKSKDIDLNDDATLKIYSRLLLFRDDQRPNAPNELVFPPDLHPQQRRIIHLIAEKLNLEHTSCGENDAKYIVINRPNSNNIDKTSKNFWNRAGFGASSYLTNPISPLQGTNVTSIGMPRATNNFFDNFHTDSRLWSAKSFNDMRTVNSQVSSQTQLSQMQTHNMTTSPTFDSGMTNVRNDLNVMMQDLSLDVNNKQSDTTEWGGKKRYKDMTIKTTSN